MIWNHNLAGNVTITLIASIISIICTATNFSVGAVGFSLIVVGVWAGPVIGAYYKGVFTTETAQPEPTTTNTPSIETPPHRSCLATKNQKG